MKSVLFGVASAAALFFLPVSYSADSPVAEAQVVDAMLSGNFTEAERLARSLVDQSPEENKPTARNLLGMVLGQSGNYDEAIAVFAQNARERPNDASAFANWAEALRRAGRPEEALEKLTKAAELQSNSRLYAIKLLLVRIEMGESTEVLEIAQQQLRQNSSNPEWLIPAAAASIKQGDWQSAREFLERLQLLVDSQTYGESLQDIAFSRYENQPELKGLFPKLAKIAPDGPLTQEAIREFSRKHFSEASRLLNEAEANGEPMGSIWNLRGGIQMEQGDFKQAVESFRRAAKLAQSNGSILMNYAEALRATGNSPQAVAIFQEALRANPGNELIAMKLAFALVENGKSKEVSAIQLRQASSGLLLIGKAAAAADQGQFETAAALLDQARIKLPQEHFASILRDPIFNPYRSQPSLLKFF